MEHKRAQTLMLFLRPLLKINCHYACAERTNTRRFRRTPFVPIPVSCDLLLKIYKEKGRDISNLEIVLFDGSALGFRLSLPKT